MLHRLAADGPFQPTEQIEEEEHSLHSLVRLWRFALARKKYWLIPVMVLSVLYGALAVFAQTSVVTPLLYALF